MRKTVRNMPVLRYNATQVEKRQGKLSPCPECGHGDVLCNSFPVACAKVICGKCGHRTETIKGPEGLWTNMWRAMDIWDARART